MDFLRLFFGFYGRIDRGTYWTIFATGMIVPSIMIVGTLASYKLSSFHPVVQFLFPIFYVLSLISIVATFVKRLHDFDKSGYWTLAMILGFLFIFVGVVVIGISAGDEGPNRFGHSPEGWMKVGKAIPRRKVTEPEDLTPRFPVS